MQNGQHIPADDELVRRFREGDLGSFRELYDMYGNRVFSTAMRMLGNRQDAEDAAQEIFISIYRNIRTWRGDASFQTWVYRIAFNTCINHLRRRKRNRMDAFEASAENERLTGADSPNPDLKLLIENEIMLLPEKCRAVFILHEIEGFKHQEIAAILKISEGTSKSQLFTAKSALRKRLNACRKVVKNEMQ